MPWSERSALAPGGSAHTGTYCQINCFQLRPAAALHRAMHEHQQAQLHTAIHNSVPLATGPSTCTRASTPAYALPRIPLPTCHNTAVHTGMLLPTTQQHGQQQHLTLLCTASSARLLAVAVDAGGVGLLVCKVGPLLRSEVLGQCLVVWCAAVQTGVEQPPSGSGAGE